MVELLAPAGDMDKLHVALSYGADAVYLAGRSFGLRGASSNFSIKEIERAVTYAHRLNRKVYLAINTFPNDFEIDYIAKYLDLIKDIEIDALIVADNGVFSLVREFTSFDIHISTQWSTTNLEGLKFWYSQGVKRIVLARELSIREASLMVGSGIELEMFIHGSMCMAYSGKCTISNYTADRDANRGGCVNSCRWDYSVSNTFGGESFDHGYIMNSKDLSAIDAIGDMISCGISSLKIEGRMKSHLYLASVVSVYRDVIDRFMDGKVTTQGDNRLNSIHNRGYSDGFLYKRADRLSLYDDSSSENRFNYIGFVRAMTDDYIVIRVKNRFFTGDILGFILFDGTELVYDVDEIMDISGQFINEAKASNIVYLKRVDFIELYNVVYMVRS